MIELKKFQSNSARLIADRYAFYANHPDRPRRGSKPRPFFQALSALTGAGKTPVLAQAVSLIRALHAREPIVFWISKARSVVGQTYTNFSEGGKYSHIIDGFTVVNVANLTPSLIGDGTSPLLIVATTGLFNNKDQGEGALNIYKKGQDKFGDSPPWDRLIAREDGVGRRPLIIVYDEGHNLSPQQAEILSELEPDAYLLASATLSMPAGFQKSVVQPIQLWVEEVEDAAPFADLEALNDAGQPDAQRFITTAVESKKVVDAELVKRAIQFDGSTAPMHESLTELFKRRKLIQQEIDARGLSIRPKTIYVCKTNIADDGEKDDPSLPFTMRTAPPIRIWRFLVEEKNVSPADIAIYANLAFADGSKPGEVNLFSKKEDDFDAFHEGDYTHIIFNLALQEGWDDPECYLAYIDKSMGSAIQVEQVIGRVLRQPTARHYDHPLLNSAHFFLRVDKQSVFTDAIQAVKRKLEAEGAPIQIIDNFGGAAASVDELHPREDMSVPLHHVFVDSQAARERIAQLVSDFPVFLEGDANSIGEAVSATHTIAVVDDGAPDQKVQWLPQGNTNPVRLRWLLNTAIRSRSSRTLAITELTDQKFDTRVQMGSKADRLTNKLAQEMVQAFYTQSDLVYESAKKFLFGPMVVSKKAPSYSHSLYEKYAGMNGLELEFAAALDGDGSPWHRNPSSGGYEIPLLSEGDTASFRPDFIAWKNGLVFCLDTKGGHLLTDAVARKLFDIQEDGKTRLLVRFITKGRQAKLGEKPTKDGFTVWKMKTGAPVAVHVSDAAGAVTESLK